MSKGKLSISDLLAQRKAIEEARPERKMAQIDAEIREREEEERAEREAARRALVAEARVGVAQAMVEVRKATKALAEVLAALDLAMAKVRAQGELETGAVVLPDLRRAVRAQLATWERIEEDHRRVSVPPAVQREQFLRGQLEHAEACLAAVRPSGRSELIKSAEAEVRRLRQELGIKVPKAEEAAPESPRAVQDAAQLAVSEGWRELKETLRAKEAGA